MEIENRIPKWEKKAIIDGIFSYLSHILRLSNKILLKSPTQMTKVSPSGLFTVLQRLKSWINKETLKALKGLS